VARFQFVLDGPRTNTSDYPAALESLSRRDIFIATCVKGIFISTLIKLRSKNEIGANERRSNSSSPESAARINLQCLANRRRRLMPHAIRVHETGGPENLVWDEISVANPDVGQARIRQTAVGVNYIDIYFRSGLYPQPLPFIPGREAVGVVEAVGPDVTSLKAGDRVVYSGVQGAYTEVRLAPVDRLIKLPDGINDDVGAAMMQKGMTAWFLCRQTYKVGKGDTILVHAAAGGVGLVLCQWAKALGATVIGTVSTEEKAELVKAHGCDYPLIHGKDDFVKVTREVTGGVGVPVVYDSIGKDTFMRSLDCIRPLGLMVLFGTASGPVPPFDISILDKKGSLFLTRPTQNAYLPNRAKVEEGAQEVFDVVQSGAVKVHINQRFALKNAADAHRSLESRKTVGSLVLVP
jgi:NADPH2:quinone reductase